MAANFKEEFNTVLTPTKHASSGLNHVRAPNSPPMKDIMMYPWNWGEGARKIQLSPSSSCGSPESSAKEVLKRGRPRADTITSLILEGSTSRSSIKCHICNRVFPREKSLQAHLRTHTGERPYHCDFPGCDKAFAQSGQLKTHQRLHTGEKPFICSAPGCESRFTHANRHCPDHPFVNLRRVQDNLNTGSSNNENSDEVLQWLEKYRREKEEKDKLPTKLKDRKLKRELDEEARLDELTCSAKRLSSNILVALPSSHRMSEQQDKWLGALALIQLAETPDSQPLNLSFHN